MTIVHLYPFVPHGVHGGTLRLRAALEASEALGATEAWFFDESVSRWSGPISRRDLRDDSVRRPLGRFSGAKRRLFPSTTFESGRAAVRSVHRDVRLGPSSCVVLHTTYLSPLVPNLRMRGSIPVVDVYDLVWRAHDIDADGAGRIVSHLRRNYSRHVRIREERLLLNAAGVLVAGWADSSHVAPLSKVTRWVPTPVPIIHAPAARRENRPLHVGLMGNFAHAPTRASASVLASSPLAASQRVRIILAGHGSEAVPIHAEGGVVRLGAVASAAEFYRNVDCVVACGTTGAGIKVKLAEAVLAGKAVITSSVAAQGYPPSLRDAFSIVRSPRELDERACEDALARGPRSDVLQQFNEVFGWGSAVRNYGRALREVANAC